MNNPKIYDKVDIQKGEDGEPSIVTLGSDAAVTITTHREVTMKGDKVIIGEDVVGVVDGKGLSKRSMVIILSSAIVAIALIPMLVIAVL